MLSRKCRNYKLGSKEIGENRPVFIICEGGVTNYGQLDLAKRQVDVAIEAKADAIKFQAWKTEQLVSKKISARLEKELKFDWFQRLREKEFSFEKLKALFDYAHQKEITVFATPHDEIALEFLDTILEQPIFKIGSGEAHNYEFVRKVGARRKPVIISFGLQSDAEVLKAIEVLQDSGAPAIIALHCMSLYPTPYNKVGLRRMLHLKKLTGVPVGISDHSIGWHVVLAAVALGACVVEKHLTFDKSDLRSLDNPGALLPEEFGVMVRQVRDIEQATRRLSESERMHVLGTARDWAGQSLVATCEIPAGTVLTREMITFKRPARGGLPPIALDSVLGRKTKTMVEEDEQIVLELLL